MDQLRHTLRLNVLGLLGNTYELINSVTHGLGFVLSLVGAGIMAAVVWRGGDPWRIAGCCLFMGAMAAVYGASTLSHMAQTRRLKRLFRMWDQALIYVLIVGTYTPFSLVYLRDQLHWQVLLAVLWILAAYGFLAKVLFQHRVDGISIWLYLLLGWLPTMTLPELFSLVPAGGMWWMVQGGVIYTLGTVFLMHDHRNFYFHAVWHVMVLLASVCHFIGVFYYVAP